MTEVTAHHGLFKDTRLHVDDTGGSGRPVVLIHGWPLSGESFRHQVPPLVAAGYRVVTYDRRGFGRSDKPAKGYTYDTLADDLHTVLTELDLCDATLVGFSMGGGEVARYFSLHGSERLRSVVFASAVPPFLVRVPGNPDGPLSEEAAADLASRLTADADGFYEQFVTDFYSANDMVAVPEHERQAALALCGQADKKAALACLAAFARTDFRADLAAVDVPAFVLHGGADGVVPYTGSGRRVHEAVADSSVHVIPSAPHGVNVSHTEQWNRALIDFLGR